MAEIKYVVASADVADIVKNITVDGAPALLTQQKYIVELTSEDTVNGVVKLVLPVEDQGSFSVGDEVTGNFQVGA